MSFPDLESDYIPTEEDSAPTLPDSNAYPFPPVSNSDLGSDPSDSPSEAPSDMSLDSLPDIPLGLVNLALPIPDLIQTDVVEQVIVDVKQGPPPIADFRRDWVTGPENPDSPNGDLFMPHFESSSRIWAGEQRRKLTFNITDATSHTDHVEKAMREPFHLSDPVPLPPEVKAATAYLSRTPDSEVLSSWKSQIRRLKDLVTACEPMQAEWDRMTPDSIRGASSGIRSVALLHLMSQFGLGGKRWMKQFIYGFDVMGTFSQDGLFPPDEK